MDSILTSIKKLLGITEEYEHFDGDVIVHINSAFATLRQLGVGPTTGFFITDNSAEWSTFISSEVIKPMAISYTHIKVKLVFDPPASSVVMEAMKNTAAELEWRILVEVEKEVA
jgi:hypothetical protein